uniref:Uncharacterized protein MANES_06G174700 n=1 Tax=Rhizophora mucronata TaxID=61149 RepID=A0A2P2MED0_RHIMU
MTILLVQSHPILESTKV